MIAVSSRWFALLVLPLLFVPVFAAEPDDKEITRLVKQLGDDDFAKREAATNRLLEIGEPALKVLQKATSDRDAERRWRAERILTTIQQQLFDEVWIAKSDDAVLTVAVSADGKVLLTGIENRGLRLWNSENGQELQPDEGRGRQDKTVQLWRVAGSTDWQTRPIPSAGVIRVAFAPQEKALSADRNTIRVWNLSKGDEIGLLIGKTDCVTDVACNAEGLVATTHSVEPTIQLWDLETRKPIRTIKTGRNHYNTSVCFSPDGKRLLTSATDGFVRIWDAKTGKMLQEIKAHDSTASSVAFSPDGKRLVSGGFDNRVRVWDAETGHELRRYARHTDFITGVAFFPDGKRLVSASRDGTARVWNAPK